MEVLTYYHLLTIFLVVIWSLIFFCRPELRRELLILGILSIFLLPIIFAVNRLSADEITQGVANIAITDLFFAFALSGIAGGLYHSLFGKHYHKLPKPERRKVDNDESYAQLWLLRFFVAYLVYIWMVLLLVLLFNISVPIAFLISSIILAVYIVSHRQDLLADALWSSFLTAFVVFLSTILASVFATTTVSIAPVVSDVPFLGVPLDLLLWSVAAGLALGPLYEFIRTFELK